VRANDIHRTRVFSRLDRRVFSCLSSHRWAAPLPNLCGSSAEAAARHCAPSFQDMSLFFFALNRLDCSSREIRPGRSGSLDSAQVALARRVSHPLPLPIRPNPLLERPGGSFSWETCASQLKLFWITSEKRKKPVQNPALFFTRAHTHARTPVPIFLMATDDDDGKTDAGARMDDSHRSLVNACYAQRGYGESQYVREIDSRDNHHKIAPLIAHQPQDRERLMFK